MHVDVGSFSLYMYGFFHVYFYFTFLLLFNALLIAFSILLYFNLSVTLSFSDRLFISFFSLHLPRPHMLDESRFPFPSKNLFYIHIV